MRLDSIVRFNYTEVRLSVRSIYILFFFFNLMEENLDDVTTLKKGFLKGSREKLSFAIDQSKSFVVGRVEGGGRRKGKVSGIRVVNTYTLEKE